MRLAVQVEPKIASALLRDELTAASASALEEYLRGAGVSLVPMHPGTNDPELRTWFQATAPANADAQEIAHALRKHESILAAYPKPLDEPP